LPLEQFQVTTLLESDLRKLLAAINDAVAGVSERNLSETRLNEAFDNSWPKLRDSLEAINKATYEDEVDSANKSLDVIGEFIGDALAQAPEGGFPVEQLAVNVARSMQTDKSTELDARSINILASQLQNLVLPKLIQSGYIKKEGELYTLTEGGRSRFTDSALIRLAMEKRIEDLLRQGI